LSLDEKIQELEKEIETLNKKLRIKRLLKIKKELEEELEK